MYFKDYSKEEAVEMVYLSAMVIILSIELFVWRLGVGEELRKVLSMGLTEVIEVIKHLDSS